MGFLGSLWEGIEDFGTDAGQFVQSVGESAVDATKFQHETREDVIKPLLKGDTTEAWDTYKDSFGEHQEMTTDNLVDSGWSESNWAVQNSDGIAAVIAASIVLNIVSILVGLTALI